MSASISIVPPKSFKGIFFAFLGLCLACDATDAAPVTAERQQQRVAYKAARAAIARGVPGALTAAGVALKDYPLYPYLVYEDLRRRLDTANADEVERFLVLFADLPLAAQLRDRWLRQLGRQRDWTTFRQFHDASVRGTTLRCYAITARVAAGEAVPVAPDNMDLWLHGASQPKACDPVFSHWRSRGDITPALIRDRARRAALAGERSLASWLGRQLPAAEARVVDTWLTAVQQPERQLRRVDRWPAAARDPDFIVPLLKQLARNNIEAAYRAWPDARGHLEPEQQLTVERDLAVLRSTDYGPDAVARLAALPREAVDEQVRAWRVRVAVARGDWRAVRHQIEAMEPALQNDSRWQYWLARSEAELGDTAASRDRFARLATRTNYYGFLSADRIGAPYALCADDSAVDTAMVAALPGVERGLELHAVGQFTDARREWRVATEDLLPEQRLEAALLAATSGWHHQAILDLAGLNRLNRYVERFPVPWSDAVAKGAQRHALPPSLIYAVMRSESSLATDARSGAGAMGLMQLLPSTARSLQNSAGVRVPNRSRLYDPETNIRLGSAYLRKLVDEYEHPLRVLVAYNAGPRPLARWDAAGRLPPEPDRWIETLPYYETREYLPRVLTFQVLYEWQIHGRMTRLERMMQPLDRPAAWPTSWSTGNITPVCGVDSRVAATP
ncbi:MAG: transglycosylase SLT domain-containing protein [Pseudomonadota bacterium]